jgi:inner membrane protein
LPTALTHAFAGAALAKVLATAKDRNPLGHSGGSLRYPLIAGFCSVFPDIDALTFWIPDLRGSLWIHRGLTHSIPFALLFSFSVALFAFYRRRPFSKSWIKVWAVLFVATASHGLLDTLTDGGAGIALLAPFSDERFFCPWRPIICSPITLKPVLFFKAGGAYVIASEIIFVWLPLSLLYVAASRWRARAARE